jgi:spore coat protein U-like protein
MPVRQGRLALAAVLAAAAWLATGVAPSAGGAYKSCEVSATGLAFGTYAVGSAAPLDSSSTIRVTCKGIGNQRTIRVSIGPGETGTVGQRFLAATPFDRLEYQIYSDASRRTPLGDGSLGSTWLTAGIRNNQTETVTVFGRVFPRQDVEPGLYRDSLRVTIAF